MDGPDAHSGTPVSQSPVLVAGGARWRQGAEGNIGNAVAVKGSNDGAMAKAVFPIPIVIDNVA